MRLALKVFLSLIALCVLTVGCLVWILGAASVPDLAGDRKLPGLSDDVVVAFDESGIPTIRAATMTDAYRALGYLHARDRLWQMETTRRIGAGRMSEIVGSPMLGYDRMMRGTQPIPTGGTAGRQVGAGGTTGPPGLCGWGECISGDIERPPARRVSTDAAHARALDDRRQPGLGTIDVPAIVRQRLLGIQARRAVEPDWVGADQ